MSIELRGTAPSHLARETSEGAGTVPAVPSSRSPPGNAEHDFRDVFTVLMRRVDEGEGLVDRTLANGAAGLDPRALIAIQAGIYRYVEAVDLTARLVDRASTALRTVLQAGSH